jgi:hypothetical protein
MVHHKLLQNGYWLLVAHCSLQPSLASKHIDPNGWPHLTEKVKPGDKARPSKPLTLGF